jgi:pyruvate/2-oxoglutarate dehydrogenase complex dihydrolipoamide dehydrogenase (E3) component
MRSSNIQRGKHLITQCVPSKQLLNQIASKKHNIISAVPSEMKDYQIEPPGLITKINLEQIMQQLYKIKSKFLSMIETFSSSVDIEYIDEIRSKIVA